MYENPNQGTLLTDHASTLHLSHLLLRLSKTIPMELKSPELKFLLRLLEYSPDYRTPISQIKLGNSKKPATERDGACKSLCSKGFVEYIDEIQQYRIEPDGKAFLKADHSALPVPMPPDELALLKAAATKSARPGDTKKIPTDDRQRLLYQLKERRFISITKSQIRDVWLTPKGIQYLLNDCVPTSSSAKLSFSMVGNYLTFLRQSLGQAGGVASGSQELSDTQSTSAKDLKLTPEVVLNTIRQLDRQFDTDNFLPIFHLREKLQPPLSREDLDRLLYGLQSRDLIELITLQDGSNYSKAELAAGIPQNIGGALFYISVAE